MHAQSSGNGIYGPTDVSQDRLLRSLHVETLALTRCQLNTSHIRNTTLHEMANLGVRKARLLHQVDEGAFVKHLRVVCAWVDEIVKGVTEGEAFQKTVRSQRVGTLHIVLDDQSEVRHDDAQRAS